MKLKFNAKDAHGNQHVIYVSQDSTVTHTVAGPVVAPNMPQFQLADGKRVLRLRKGRYQVEGAGQLLTSDDPDAP
jgi:hypothetical protein